VKKPRKISNKKLLRLDEELYRDENDEEENDYRAEYRRKPRYKKREEVFKCKHCRRFVCPLPSGGSHRNHCPFCLYSRHVDGRESGDRMSCCGASMEPIGRFQRAKGEYVIVHRCLGCEFERFNRIAADDDFELVMSLAELPSRTSREMKAQKWEAWLAEREDLWGETEVG
jgi:hypothetical protein